MPFPCLRWRRAALVACVASSSLWSACSDQPLTQPRDATARAAPGALPLSTRQNPRRADILAAVAAVQKHGAEMLRIPGVVGVAVTATPDGETQVKLLLARTSVPGLPQRLENIAVTTQVTGLLVARSDPTLRVRPAPTGYSVGHPSITAGTIAARVVDASGNVYALSNNHVLANSNNASIGDAMLQPGPFDGGVLPADQIGTLFAFKPINFSGGANTFDAAIALSSTANLSNSTPTDDGYGAPNGTIFGDANGDGVFDDKSELLNLAVKKYGRTTKLTHGTVTGINATVSICYEVIGGIFCTKSATFTDQLIIEPGGFSGGGDSGSLIVTDDVAANPVALLFAGSSTQTIANRIDLVLNYFGVHIDGSNTPPPPPPDPVTDVAITGVSAPASITVGGTANVVVTVRNVGNQAVGGFAVNLRDATASTDLGTGTITSLAPGASATMTFPWNTTGAALGAHTLVASHNFADDNAANDQALATSNVVSAQSTDIHVGDLDGTGTSNGANRWSARVEVTMHNFSHTPINNATVVGRWNPNAFLVSNTCTTGELGTTGSCVFLYPSISKGIGQVTFTVTSVTMNGRTYRPAQNHDVDGSSNGTVVTVARP